MNKESFLQNTSWIDMLKFKISYGAQGNDNIGNYYAYLDQYTVSNSNNDFALALSYKGNKDITWETKVATDDMMLTVYGGLGTHLRPHGFDEYLSSYLYSVGGVFYDSGYRRMMHESSSSFAPDKLA